MHGDRIALLIGNRAEFLYVLLAAIRIGAIAVPLSNRGQTPELTAGCFAHGYWKSGDIGSQDDLGFIRLHDRKKDKIIRGGYNIYSTEVENVLSAHPEIIECAVIGVPDPVLVEKPECSFT